MQSNSCCTSKTKPQGKMFKKNDPKKMTISRKRACSLQRNTSWRGILCRHSFWLCLPRCIKTHRSLSPASQEPWCFICLESSVFIPSTSPAHLYNFYFNTSCYPYFLFLKLIIRIAVFCQQLRASVTLCLLMLWNNSDQAEKHLTAHHFPPNWVHWSLSWQDLKENRKKRDYIIIWMVQKLLFSNAAVECKDSALQTPLLRPISNETHDTCLQNCTDARSNLYLLHACFC